MSYSHGSRGCLAFILVFACCLLFTSEADATEFQYYWEPPQKTTGDCRSHGNGIAGSLKRLEATYDSVTHMLNWKATFSPCTPSAGGSYLPDGYYLAMNHGPNPKSAEWKELAGLYFDASHLFNGLDEVANPTIDHPILTAYHHTGSNSYRDGDKIATNHPDAPTPNFVKEISAHNNADGTRTLSLSIDATVIKNWPGASNWWGIGFDMQLGFWWHPISGFQTSYCTGQETSPAHCVKNGAGYLNTKSHTKYGWYDTAWRDANKVPYCITKFDRQVEQELRSCIEVNPGESFDAIIIGNDGNDTQLTPTHRGTPAGSTVKVGANDIAPDNSTPYDVPVEVSFSWTPKITDAGSNHTAIFTFTDDGFENIDGSQADTCDICQIPLCVPENDPPECKIAIDSTPSAGTNEFQCEGAETTVEFNATGSTDPEAGPLTYAWSVECKDKDGNVVTEGISPLGIAGEQSQLSVTTPYDSDSSVTCTVKLVVTDNLKQSDSCQTEVRVDPCPRDCLGTPLGEAQLDRCGVCDGNDACIDCADTPFGGKVFDICGVCGGENNCFDCAGSVNGDAQIDRCGVCGGDGQSCLGCADTDITNAQFEMDGGALEQRNTILKSLGRVLERDNSKKQKRFAKRVRTEANGLYTNGWTLTWSLPQIVTQCENQELCVEVSNADTLDNYTANSSELLALNKRVIRRLRNLAGNSLKNGRTRGHKLVGIARRQHNDNIALADSVPRTASSCN